MAARTKAVIEQELDAAITEMVRLEDYVEKLQVKFNFARYAENQLRDRLTFICEYPGSMKFTSTLDRLLAEAEEAFPISEEILGGE